MTAAKLDVLSVEYADFPNFKSKDQREFGTPAFRVIQRYAQAVWEYRRTDEIRSDVRGAINSANYQMITNFVEMYSEEEAYAVIDLAFRVRGGQSPNSYIGSYSITNLFNVSNNMKWHTDQMVADSYQMKIPKVRTPEQEYAQSIVAQWSNPFAEQVTT
jgi:hypothetical protein